LKEPADDGVPRAAGLRLTFLILEGYIYLALIIAIFFAASGFLIWGVLTRRPFIAIVAIMVGVPVAATTARALRALWFLFPEPVGIRVDLNFGAQLYREVQEIAERMGAPRVHRVIVTDANNAAAVQTPRAGVFWPTNTLVLGYPLLATLSVDQIRAVIAHELGHLTHAHSRFASWVHRTRLSWLRLLEILERHQSVPAHVYFLFRFYVPRLDARATAISRQQELLADRLAAAVAGPEVAAQALTAIAIGQRLADETFWPRIYKRVDEDPDPPNPFSQLRPGIWDHVENGAQLLDRLLEQNTTAADTHSALRDRLAKLGEPPRWPGPVQTPAADYFFGAQKQDLAVALDRQWQEPRRRGWRKLHDEIRHRRDRLVQLAALAEPSPEHTFERGRLLECEGDEDTALQLYLSAHRQGLAAGLAAGRILLNREDASGIALIDTAMDADAALIEHGCKSVAEFLERRGRHADAHRYQGRMTRETTKTSMARAERAKLSVVDRLRPCADQNVGIPALSRRLALEPGVRRAFLATKELRYSNGTQLVLAVVVKNGIAADLGERLSREGLLPDGVMLITLGPHDHALEAALGAVAGGLIYDGSPSGG
jgi:Zn-dependent protease with chaperone function